MAPRPLAVTLVLLAWSVASLATSAAAQASDDGLVIPVSAPASARRVAVLLPLTGEFAPVGVQMQRGFALAEIALAEQVGHAVEVRYFDSASDPAMLPALLREQVDPWGPALLVGPYSSEGAAVLATEAKRRRIPLLVPSATMDRLTQDPDGVVFRLATPQSQFAEVAAAFLLSRKSQWKFETVHILAEDDPFGREGAKALAGEFRQVELPEPRIAYYRPGRAGAQMAEPSLRRAPVLVAIGRSTEDARQIVDQMDSQARVVGLYGGFASPEFRLFAASRPAGSLPALYVVTPWQDDSPRPQTVQFIQRFANKYRDALDRGVPQYHAAQAYSALLVAAAALTDADGRPDDLFAALRSQTVDTPLGPVRFMDYGGYFRQSPTTAVVQAFAPTPPHTVFPAPVPATEPAAAPARERGILRTLLENQIVALFAVLGLGILLGNIEIKGIGLGNSGVLFVALAFGHFKFTIPSSIGTLGLVLFVYGVGIAAGPGFFRAFVKHGANLAKVAAILVIAGAATTYACAKAFHIPTDLAVGIFAGSMTSTPALAAALDQLKEHGSLVSIGYGVAYPFGVVGVVLFVQLLPRLLRVDLNALDAQIVSTRGTKKSILRVVVEVTNPAVIGKPLLDVQFIQRAGCQVVRVMQGQRAVPIGPDLILEAGAKLLLVGTESNLASVVDYLGKRSDEPFFMDAERERKQIVVTSPALVGRSLRGLDLLRRMGVTVSRIVRNDVSFVPDADTIIERFDTLTCVGEPTNLDQFATEAGHRAKALDETDLASLAVGIVAGVVVGMMPLGFGTGKSFTLGMAGGPLFVALILGHFGRIGRITGHVPRAARIFMTELGLVFFLAGAGVSAGSHFVEVVKAHGVVLFLVGVLVTLVPMAAGYLVSRFWFKLNLLETLGGTCGGMTSTPGLGAVTAKTDSDIPVICYATAYPVALILMTILTQILIPLLR